MNDCVSLNIRAMNIVCFYSIILTTLDTRNAPRTLTSNTWENSSLVISSRVRGGKTEIQSDQINKLNWLKQNMS